MKGVYKSSKDGKIVSKAFADANPDTTYFDSQESTTMAEEKKDPTKGTNTTTDLSKGKGGTAAETPASGAPAASEAAPSPAAPAEEAPKAEKAVAPGVYNVGGEYVNANGEPCDRQGEVKKD